MKLVEHSNEQTVLEMRGCSHRAGGVRILDDASWQVRRGEHWAVLGPNGAGKTTLLRIASGYLWPNDGGSVIRAGEEHPDLRELRRSIGWVTSSLVRRIPEQEAVLDTVVSGKFAQLGLFHMEWDPPQPDDYEVARRYLAELAATDLIGKLFGQLSQGEQQKVLLARARMALPLLIILDEPCAGLDPGARELFLHSIEQLAQLEHCPSLVLVTHHIEEIMPAFTHTLVLNDAKVIAAGPTSELVNPRLMEQLYGAPVAKLERHGG
ncbi:MAG: ATP-binding cassette domain-containing protein, partial [Pirellulales bacterium]